ncbi:hypothetical protein LTR37_010428 [Vermiconidia calcicola]|uniref:Uncharacterized protein n=1 Tax=Vermiconidia calcicola TaxID=1690605 RepID=A0ACC3N7S5_9PEZI|nr:hypothetical protein LTR37_010428 [Vermiconidia calcicola]
MPNLYDLLMEEYCYFPLASDEIRLLELLPSDPESELHGKLEKFRLQESEEITPEHEVLITREGVDVPNAPPYEALSYTWGSLVNNKAASIKVLQGHKLCKLPITRNLHGSLARLRRELHNGQAKRLWVDAICIHQSNIPEKNAQVRKMAMVYNRAKNVCVWLGNGDGDSRRAIDFIGKLLRLDDFDPLTQDPGTESEWAALNNLMQRPWFNRRWIVQEISLARDAVLFCGDQSVSWHDFSAAVSLFAARHRDLRHLFQRSSEFHHHPNYLGEVEALGAKALVDITSYLFRKSKEGVVLERLMSLEEVVSTLTLFEAGSPHDIIYAVLWLAYDAEPDSKEHAAMSLEPNVRTPNQSPDLESVISSEDDRSLPNICLSPLPLESPESTEGAKREEPQEQPRPGSRSTQYGEFLKPPHRKSRPTRSASDHSLRWMV